jgi:hypothetical protein
MKEMNVSDEITTDRSEWRKNHSVTTSIQLGQGQEEEGGGGVSNGPPHCV